MIVAVAVAAVMFVLARNLVRSRVGRASIAQRDDQTAAAAFAVNLAVYRTLISGTSAAFAGVAGPLLMIQKPIASVGQFDVYLAIYLFVAVVIGGVGILSGAVPGAIVFVFVPLYTSQWSREFTFLHGRLIAPADMLYGVLLFAVAFVAPGGVIDGIRRVRTRIVRVVLNPSWLTTAKRVEGADAIDAGAVVDEDHMQEDASPNRGFELDAFNEALPGDPDTGQVSDTFRWCQRGPGGGRCRAVLLFVVGLRVQSWRADPCTSAAPSTARAALRGAASSSRRTSGARNWSRSTARWTSSRRSRCDGEHSYKLDAPGGVLGRNSDDPLVKKLLGWTPTIRRDDGLEKTPHLDL